MSRLTEWLLVGLAACAVAVVAIPSQAEEGTARPVDAAPARATRDPALGRQIPHMVLADPSGERVGLYDFQEARYLVVTFLNTSCPISNRFLPVLNELAEKYRSHGVQFLAINSHAGDSPEDIARHAREFSIVFPVWCDPEQVAADVFSAERTCETFVLDPQKYVRYRGRIDDRFGYGTERVNPTRNDLSIALDELIAGQPVSVATTDVAGCKLKRTRRAAPRGEITWSKDVAAIVQNRCERCHHANTAAPIALQSYSDVVNWAEMIREVVQQRRMPPWHADPRFGDFVDERRMTQQELDTLLAWIDDGLPPGDLSQTPAPRDYPDGWRIGEPDVVFEMPEEVTLPAQGAIPYMFFEAPSNFTEDKWVQMAEARPGNRAAVHHIILYYRLPDQKVDDSFRGHWIDGAAPGNNALIFPVGVGRRIPAGAILIWEMHYTATGKVEKDRSQYAFKFCATKPEREAHMIAVVPGKGEELVIPANVPNHKVVAKMTLEADVEVLGFAPHMHLRGRDFEYRAIDPVNKTAQVLLSMPQYDFNWQTGYGVKNPVKLAKGTVIECTAHFDNSRGNPNNPDPNVEVRWGRQTWEEMMIGFMEVVPAK